MGPQASWGVSLAHYESSINYHQKSQQTDLIQRAIDSGTEQIRHINDTVTDLAYTKT